MATRTKVKPIVDTENLQHLAQFKNAKNVIQRQPTLATRRPALEDVANKIHATTKAVTKFTNKVEVKKKVEDRKKSTTIIVKPSISSEALPVLENVPSKVSLIPQIEDPDFESRDDPQMMTEYIIDIFKYLREIEVKYDIQERYLDNGHKTTAKMRGILMNWLVEVHTSFHLHPNTLHICVGIVDRYLQVNVNVGKETLQLVGITALLIASKYEELYFPELGDYVFVCDDTFTKKEILQMEIKILRTLDCRLGKPPSIDFLRRYSKIAKVGLNEYNLSKYILELAIINYGTCHHRPSLQAAAACCLSIAIMNNEQHVAKIWTPTLVHYTNYKYSDFKGILYQLAHLLTTVENWKNQAVREKYMNAKFAKISLNTHLKGPLVKMLADKSNK